MTIAITRRSPIPLYFQVESWLREQMAGGRFRDGHSLPTEEALVRRLGVSRITVRRAMERLVQEGVIYRVPGRGTFVNPLRGVGFRIERNPADLLGFEEDIRRAGFVPETEVLRHDWVRPPAEVAKALGLDGNADVLWLRRRGTAGGRPLWVEDRYVVRALASRLRPRDFSVPSLLAMLARERGLVVDRAQVHIAAREAAREEARALGLKAGAPVLVAEFAVNADGHPAQFVRARFRPDRYAFRFAIHAQAALQQTSLSRESVHDGQ